MNFDPVAKRYRRSCWRTQVRDIKFRWPLGGLAHQIFTRARDWSTFASAHPKNFKGEHKKFGLKFSNVRAYYFGVNVINITKLRRVRRGARQAWYCGYNFWKWYLQQNLRGQKTWKIWHDSDNFRLWSQISLKRIDVTKIWKLHYQLHLFPYWAKKIWFGGLWSTYKKVIGVNVDPPKWTFYNKLYFDCYTHYNPQNCISSRIWGAGRPQVGLCPIFLVVCFFNTSILWLGL